MAIILFQLKTVFLIHWHSGQKWSAPTTNHIRKALLDCNFYPWDLNSLFITFNHKYSIYSTQNVNSEQHSNSNNKNISIVVPYIKGLSERFKKTCNSLGIPEHFKGNNTIQTLLMAPKDKDSKCHKSGVINQFKCPHSNCQEEYIGESGRSFGDRLKENLRAPSPIHHHSTQWDILSMRSVSP